MVGGDTLEIIQITEGSHPHGANMDAAIAPRQESYYKHSNGKLSFTLLLRGDFDSNMRERLKKNPPNIFIYIPKRWKPSSAGREKGLKTIENRSHGYMRINPRIEVSDRIYSIEAILTFDVDLTNVTGDIEYIPESIKLKLECSSWRNKWDTLKPIVNIWNESGYTCRSSDS